MSKIETFRFIEYSDQSKFVITEDGKIQLKEYIDNLILYSSFDNSINADFSIGDPNASSGDSYQIENFGVFGQYLHLINDGYIEYSNTNFSGLNEFSLQFRLRTGFNNGKGYQDFLGDTVSPGDTDYSFKLLVNGDSQNPTISLNSGDTMQTIANKIDAAINNAHAFVLAGGNIRIEADNFGDSIQILNPDSGNNLITLLGGTDNSYLPNPPTVDTEIIKFYNASEHISLIHKTDGHLEFQINSNVFDLGIWNAYYLHWDAFEINFNENIFQIFINGKQVFSNISNFSFSSNPSLRLSSTNGNSYRFDELIILNKYNHTSNFTVPSEALTKYPTDNPYIDIHFGTGFKENEVEDLNVVSSPDCRFVVKPSNEWYYYLSGSWRISDGSFLQSTEPGILETKFSELYFDENKDLIIRVYFHSDGNTQVWLDEIEIVINTGAGEAAIITGSVDLSNPVDLSSNYYVVITTDQGEKQVNLKSAAGDSTAVSLDEIKQAIDDAQVPGLAPASDDGNGHLVLQSETVGETAYVSISHGLTNDALGIIWGYEATDEGAAPIGPVVDYSELFRWVRSMLGAPTIPVELTDEQLEDALVEVLYEYNRWRNFDESLVYITLEGNPRDGYKIPDIVGGKENILEIILAPRYPFTYYAGRTDLITNLYIQYMFAKYKAGYSNILTDYWITMSTEQDINIILGTQVKWSIMNNRLFIWPEPSNINVGIKYRSVITLEEINSNVWIRKLLLAKAKIILGGIRSTFKSGIPGGTEMLQLNGDDLKAEGQQEWAAIVEDMRKSTEPLFIEFF